MSIIIHKAGDIDLKGVLDMTEDIEEWILSWGGNPHAKDRGLYEIRKLKEADTIIRHIVPILVTMIVPSIATRSCPKCRGQLLINKVNVSGEHAISIKCSTEDCLGCTIMS